MCKNAHFIQRFIYLTFIFTFLFLSDFYIYVEDNRESEFLFSDYFLFFISHLKDNFVTVNF